MSVLYTPLAPEVVLAGQEQEMPPCREIQLAGVSMLVEACGPSQFRIVRLLSTNPRDYLRAELQPGTILGTEIILGSESPSRAGSAYQSISPRGPSSRMMSWIS